MTTSSFARDLFFAIHDGLPRQAPGSRATTAQALEMTGLKGAIDVLDIGCGPGMHTLHLAALLPEAKLTGADAHQPYLDELQQRAKAAELDGRIRTRRTDMKALPFEPKSFDLL